MKELDAVMEDSTSTRNAMKKRLDMIKVENDEFERKEGANSGLYQMRLNLYQVF